MNERLAHFKDEAAPATYEHAPASAPFSTCRTRPEAVIRADLARQLEAIHRNFQQLVREARLVDPI